MFSCCFWWFLLGLVIGWLLNWLMCRCLCQRNKCHTKSPCCESTSAPTAQNHFTASEEVAPTVAAAAYVLDSTAAKAAGFKLKNPNDLTVIEGIGPKINELFNQAGITTFAQLAQQTVPQMQKILDAAGPSYKLARPDTWAQQASLAAENKWAELKALQDKLNGGV